MTTSNEHNNAPAVPQDMRLVPVWLLERVEQSLGSFTSDEGWSQSDMDTMDSVSALLAAAPAPAPAVPFGYFRAEPFGWTDCAATDEGAIALYAHPAQPAQEVASAFTTALDIRLAQGWNLTGNVIPVLYTDTINDYQVRRDDVWLCTTDALKTEQEVGLTDEWISVSDRLPDVEPGAPAIEFYNEDLRKPTRQVIGIYRYGEWLSGGHQFSNVTYWKPLTPAPIAALRAKESK